MKFKLTSKHLKGAILILGCYTFLALLFTPQTYISNSRSATPLTWGEAFISGLVLFYIWAAMTPLVLWLGRRIPIERPNIVRNLFFLFFIGCHFAVVHIVVLSLVNDLFLSWTRNYSPPVPVQALIVGLGATNVMIFWGILAAGLAINYFSKYKEREFRLIQAQIQVLRMQLHPHFLFNTLNAISELVYDEPEVADRTITQLSDLLRLSLKSGKTQEVTLKEELDFLQKYLEIQQTLLQERLAVNLKIDSEALDACVPNMILQPLVENAIRHGIAPRATGGTLEVSARREESMLLLNVRDDGLGIKEESLRAGPSSGIGLANTQARLKHLYGNAHSFDLSRSPEGGLTVSLTIPYRENKD